MKILYIVPKINGQGGVQKIIALRTDYLITNNLAEIGIVTQNEGNKDCFFNFNNSINFFDISTSSNKIKTFFLYRSQINAVIEKYEPSIIIVCDFGLKGFLFPFLINTKVPVLFEVHGSKYNEPVFFKQNKFNILLHKIKYCYRNYSIKKYKHILFLSEESRNEWGIKRGFVLPNPIELKSIRSNLESNKVIALTRFSYEKGIDRLLKVWEKVIKLDPNLELHLYGESDVFFNFEKHKNESISKNIFFNEPVVDTEEIYLQASLYVMTSRSEGFPLVLLEAMNYGLPIIAYDCPVGPRALIQDGLNGFLIPDDNEAIFVEKLNKLMSDIELRKNMGTNAKQFITNFEMNKVVSEYNSILISIANNS